jgi:pimeloyl-ACP methyl ester carboxylesterase
MVNAVPVLRPAFVMWAPRDRFLLPSWAVRLAHEMSGCTQEPTLLPFAGHFFQVDVPRTAARVLGEFLDSVS